MSKEIELIDECIIKVENGEDCEVQTSKILSLLQLKELRVRSMLLDRVKWCISCNGTGSINEAIDIFRAARTNMSYDQYAAEEDEPEEPKEGEE